MYEPSELIKAMIDEARLPNEYNKRKVRAYKKIVLTNYGQEVLEMAHRAGKNIIKKNGIKPLMEKKNEEMAEKAKEKTEDDQTPRDPYLPPWDF